MGEAMTRGQKLLALVVRLVAIGWALVAGAALLLLIPAGYLVGLSSWAEDWIAGVYLLAQFALAVTAAIVVAHRPLIATVALAGIALLLASGLALFLSGIADHSTDPHSWQHKAWRYVLPAAAGSVAAALVLPLLGWYLARHGRSDPQRTGPGKG